MSKLISVLGVGVAAISLSVATVPATAMTVHPGPVKLVFPEASEPGDMRPGTTSTLYVSSSSFDLARGGPIVWRGRVYQGGRLKFPAAKQTWPTSILSDTSIKRLAGTIGTDGKVRLEGTMKAVVSAPGVSCTTTSPITLSTRIRPGPVLGNPGGQDCTPSTGKVALMSKPLRLTSVDGGSGCGPILYLQPLLYLTGSMKLP
jgi:hypothetical protein